MGIVKTFSMCSSKLSASSLYSVFSTVSLRAISFGVNIDSFSGIN